MKQKASQMGSSARSVLGVVCVLLLLLLGFNFSPAALQRASSTMNLPHNDSAEEVTDEVRLELAREDEVKLRPRKPLETSPRCSPPPATSTTLQSRPPHDQQMSSSPPSAVFSVGEPRDIGYYFGAGGLTKRFGSTLSSSLKLTKAHLNNGMVAPFAPAAEPLHDREDSTRGMPQRYPNHTGLLHIAPTLPFP
ncbi:membrane-associated protein, putative, partial [Bodo saltans]